MSAFSIITAILFNYDQTKYTTIPNKNDFDPEMQSSSQSSSSLSASSGDGDHLESFIQNYYESPFITDKAEFKPKITLDKRKNNNF